jgi:FHA domain
LFTCTCTSTNQPTNPIADNMTSVFPHYPYSQGEGKLREHLSTPFSSWLIYLSNVLSLHSCCFTSTEPTDDWSVEQVLQYYLLRAHKETEEKYHQIETSLSQQFEKGTSEIWECHTKVLEAGSKNSPIRSSSANTSGTKAQTCEIPMAKTTSKPTTIHVQIVAGPHAPRSYEVVPKPKFPCFVGRSQGTKFKNRGVSLHKDSEISTTHGQFEVRQGKLYYTDLASTNGSKVGGEDLTPDTPLLLENGTELVLGQSTLKITLS